MTEELTLSVDEVTGEYSHLTRFHPGADTRAFGGQCHTYPEEIFIVSGRLHDEAFGLWLGTGASREPPARRTARAVQDGRGLRSTGDLISQPNRWAPVIPREATWNT